MIFGSDMEEPERDFRPTQFDLARIEAMSVGDKVAAEYGEWQVFRYKTGYDLYMDRTTLTFKNINDLIKYFELWKKPLNILL